MSKTPKLSHRFLKFGIKLQEKGKDRMTESEKTELKHAIWTDKDFIEFCRDKRDWTPREHDLLKVILEMPKNENGYYVDTYGERVSYNGIRTLRRSHAEFDISRIHQNEIDKCRDDFRYFRSFYCLITTKSGLARPDLREYQEKLESNLLSGEDCVILFPRQSGKTVTSGNFLLWNGVFHEDAINIGIVANKPSTAAEVLDKIKKTFSELPIWLQPGIVVWNKGSIEYENGTRIMTDGPSSDSFRGYTINIVYLDELAYFKKSLWEEFSDSVFPTMNSLIFKQIIMTSTANGTNHFKHICDAAQSKDTPEKFITCDWKDVPHYSKDGKLLEPAVYKRRTVQKYGKKFFAQTEECTFLGSSDTLISGEALRDIQDRVENAKPIPQVVLNDGSMFNKPIPGHNYLLTVDPAKDGIDAFAVNVVDVTGFPFEQVFTAKLQIDYLMMPEHLNELGKYYNNAFIIVENNEGAGQSVTDQLWRIYEYENLYRDKNLDGRVGFKKYTGFRTTIKSRQLILNMLKIFVDEGKLLINSEDTLEQLYTFTKRKTGNKYEAEDGYHDDMVMSLALTFAPFMEIKVFDDFSLFTKQLHKRDSNQKSVEFMSALDFGVMDDGSEDNSTWEREAEIIREVGMSDYAPAVPVFR